MPNDIVEIKDFDLARVIREQLEKQGKRDNRFKTLVYSSTFTKDELASIASLQNSLKIPSRLSNLTSSFF